MADNGSKHGRTVALLAIAKSLQKADLVESGWSIIIALAITFCSMPAVLMILLGAAGMFFCICEKLNKYEFVNKYLHLSGFFFSLFICIPIWPVHITELPEEQWEETTDGYWHTDKWNWYWSWKSFYAWAAIGVILNYARSIEEELEYIKCKAEWETEEKRRDALAASRINTTLSK
ncbi:MAG: hypothetical protein LBM19_03505 [Holosporales bacterium]|nr:hypothetical protein [Holosporales bacterium]